MPKFLVTLWVQGSVTREIEASDADEAERIMTSDFYVELQDARVLEFFQFIGAELEEVELETLELKT